MDLYLFGELKPLLSVALNYLVGLRLAPNKTNLKFHSGTNKMPNT